jgi:thioredoxin reductase
MDDLFELLIYALVGLICFAAVFFYLRKQKRQSEIVSEKIGQAKAEGLFEPVSLHPVVNPNTCIQTGACILACPEKDILGIRNGKATTINASRCVGHGACFHACPTQAITLCIGTEKRGVELPHVDQNFETNVPGLFIAGELGGMGLIKNAVEQGKQAVSNIVKKGMGNHTAEYDLVIVGAGPAGISASLAAKKNNLRFITLEQDTLGGTVFTFPRAKVVMTAPMELPIHGKVKLYETTKTELLKLWMDILEKYQIPLREQTKVESITAGKEHFRILTSGSEEFTARFVVLAIGRRGTPRKLGITGENLEKVAYRLLEPEQITGKKIIVVGGGDSAIESALLLAGMNEVILSYRGDSFARIKPKNLANINAATQDGLIDVQFGSQLTAIEPDVVHLSLSTSGKQVQQVPNDLVYIFAGGELPTQFLSKAGITITKKFGEAILKH